MPDVAVPATFEDIAESDQIGIDVTVRVVDGVAHAGLGGEIDHHVETVVPEQLRQCFPISHVDPPEAEGPGRTQPFKPGLFQTRIVECVQVVYGEDPVSLLQQSSAKRRPDESCAAGYQDIHAVRPQAALKPGRCAVMPP